MAINKNFEKKDIIDVYCSRYEFAQPISKVNHFQNLPPINPVKNLWTIDTSISESIDYGRNLVKKILESFEKNAIKK